MEPRLMKVPEVVERLGLSRAKVYELVASCELQSVRIAGARRVETGVGSHKLTVGESPASSGHAPAHRRLGREGMGSTEHERQ
jgi:hypothetical protein